MAERVLVAEDDPGQAELLALYLRREGFDVDVVHDGLAALAHATSRPPDLVVLDVMMPGLDGIAVCRKLDAAGAIPVVMLTARSLESDVLLGLYSGADDYLTKPFSPRELVARVRTVLRRSRRGEEATRAEVVAGDVAIRVPEHEVRVAGALIDLTPVEFDILLTLAERRDLVVSRHQLLESIHGDARYLHERTVDSHVMNLRRKLETDPRRPQRLRTVYGLGYKLVSERFPADP